MNGGTPVQQLRSVGQKWYLRTYPSERGGALASEACLTFCFRALSQQKMSLGLGRLIFGEGQGGGGVADHVDGLFCFFADFVSFQLPVVGCNTCRACVVKIALSAASFNGAYLWDTIIGTGMYVACGDPSPNVALLWDTLLYFRGSPNAGRSPLLLQRYL